ncbi:enoyl-CoA hydratase/isomerase family protein [Pseudonocardia bannensis]|uniref:Enoyl-CoA hydratase/isomerase family protein n=1 Tax=Pseudonocardia bannensis TaxID=630973 RepID=A0A848DPV5_9PSEU|nr:enoyl-CoA hydratase/isomerase family protein [Pseudonocardia bannensis]NMH94880.1 enoyl-CoA hydratase/isomerase family protein [Pseudonocardia bannensis]
MESIPGCVGFGISRMGIDGCVIEREDRGKVAVIRLAREPVNAMDVEFLEAIWKEIRELPGGVARAAVITGAGNTFSAGVDLGRLLGGGQHYVHNFLPLLSRVFEALFTCPLPVVAAVNGDAFTGGCVLACCADRRLMADGDGRIGVRALKVGLPMPRIALEILKFAVGETTATKLMLGAETHLPREAARYGLIDEVVGPTELLDRAVDEATRMAEEVPADTFNVTKSQLHRDTVERIDRYSRDEDLIAQRLWVEHQVDGWVARFVESKSETG